VALKLGPFKIPWPGKGSRDDDPYWNFFINTPPADLANTVTEMIRSAPDGNIFPTRAELHTPDITSSHVKELASYLGTDLIGIARLTPLPTVGEGKGEGKAQLLCENYASCQETLENNETRDSRFGNQH